MDILTETLFSHKKRIEEKQRMLKAIPRVQAKIENEIDQLQKEFEIMKIEINAGKNLS